MSSKSPELPPKAFRDLPPHQLENFTRFAEAAREDRLSIVSAIDLETGEPCELICAVNTVPDPESTRLPPDLMYSLVPFAKLLNFEYEADIAEKFAMPLQFRGNWPGEQNEETKDG